jgi:lipopolysaccharide/colanic/teichoic acid biosynthesis glycosyltransferase
MSAIEKTESSYLPSAPSNGTREVVGDVLEDALKRTLDVVVATVLLVALAPLLLLLAVLILVTTPGPVVYRQVRLGRAERRFVMLKFRTMYVNSSDNVHRDYVTRLLTEDEPPASSDGLYKLLDDPRVTPIGRWLRRTSCDELPQLLNVLHGEMTLVGPRPALPWEAELYEARHRVRHLVKPGMTGLWQVEGRSSLGMREALDLDVDYVRRRNLLLDLVILFRTARVVFDKDRAA